MLTDTRRAGNRQPLGLHHGVKPALAGRIRVDELPGTHVHRVSVDKPGHDLEPGPGADEQLGSHRQIDKFLAHEEVHEHADTVSAHFGDRAVGIAVVHEPAGLRLGREDLPTLRQAFGGHRADQSVAADAAAAVADRRDLFGAQVVFVCGVGDEHEIVSGAVPLRVAQWPRDGQK